MALSVALTGAFGCGGGDETASPGGGGDPGDAAWTGDGPISVSTKPVTVTDVTGTFSCYPTTCSGKLLECGDCVDNDGDNKIDAHDRECLGPCDNTEGPALTAGIGGETGGPCKADCYFDFGNGPGNDNCLWDHQCDPLAVAPLYPPEGKYDQTLVGSPKDCPANQSDQCLNYCRPLTPNGCDCFGCCTFPELAGRGPNNGPGYVWIGSMDDMKNGTCTFADVLEPTKCKPCTPVEGCWNDCGKCELCLGKDTLPPECTPPDGGTYDGGPPPARCPTNVMPCGLPGDAMCPVDTYCVTGCCVPTVIIN